MSQTEQVAKIAKYFVLKIPQAAMYKVLGSTQINS